MSDEKQSENDTKVIIKRNSFCSTSPTGKHQWKAINGHYICELCDCLTSEQVLVG